MHYCALNEANFNYNFYLSLLDCNQFNLHIFFSELYLDGNDLGCEGAVKLIQSFANHAELEAAQRAEEERLKAEQEALRKF